MKSPSPKNDPAAARRAAAEAQLKKQNKSRPPQSEADARRLQHELEVHQIELEMLNEELLAHQADIELGLERYTNLFEFAPVGYFNLIADGTIRLVNLTGAKLLGAERANLTGKRFGLLVAENDRKLFSEFLTRVFQTNKNEVCELTMSPQGRSLLIVRLEAKVSPDGDRCRLMMLDITEQKQAEEELRAVDRALKTVSACNRAMVRSTDETQLLQAVCEAIVEKGGYRMVWIGFPERDNRKPIRVIASAGHDKGYLEKAKINWLEDDERGQGPSGVAFRTGQVVVCNDFQTDPNTGPWREEAAVRGYAASISLPLKHGGESFGVMMIYAKEINAFHDDEKNLLAELADDLSYGMNALRVCHQQAEAEAELRASEERFRKMFSEHAAVKLITDAETGDIVDANAAAARFYGWSVAQLKQMKISQINTLDAAALKGVMQKVKTGEQSRFEFQHRRADGSIRDVEVFSNRIKIGGKSLLYAIVQDITERKRAEEKLSASEKHYQTIIDSSPVPLATNDKQQITYLNRAFVSTFGYTLKDIPTIADWWPKAYPDPQYRKIVMDDWDARMEKVKQTGGPFEPMEVDICSKDGTSKKMVVGAASLSEQAYQGEHLVVFHDITERKRAEEVNARLAAIVESSGDAIISTDLNGVITTWNLGAEKIFGFTAIEIIGTSILRLIPAERQAEDHKILETVKRGESLLHFETVRQTKALQQLRVAVTVSPITDNTGKIIGVSKILRDITEQKLVERSLTRLATAVEQAAETIVITNKEGAILYANPMFEKTSGYARAEAIGQNPRLLKSGNQDANFYHQMWAVLNRGEVWKGRFKNKRKDGSLYEEEATITPIRDTLGEIINFVAVKRDVTREVQLERQFNEIQKMEAIGQLAAGVAHDYNNILAATNVQLGMLLMDKSLKPDVREALKDLKQGSDRAASLTRQLLLFSHRQAIKIKPLELNHLLDDLLKMIGRIIGERISLTVQANTKDAWIEGDSGMIEQIVMNLAINARDAMPKGGRLIIRINELTISSENIRNMDAKTDQFISLSVGDDGCGMSEETKKRIFEPFFTTKGVGKGTGLGLATVYGIVQQHRGWIEVDSQVGKGSVFRVLLPKSRPQTTIRANHDSPELINGTETILVVEDEESVRRPMVLLLKMAGYNVFEAENAVEALKMWSGRLNVVDLLFTDMIMPGGVDGKQLADTFQKIKPTLPVLITSGYSTKYNTNALNSGTFENQNIKFIAKPFHTNDLLETIKECLSSNSQAN